MCGIVGILGREAVAGQLVDALRRLEYRGYDSAGVATVENGHLERRRAEGKLKNLEIKLDREPLSGMAGIGHTRWATHGRPNETNAHPHATDKLAVVHNGIIENFRELREELEKAGAVFGTETDTEVVAQARHRADEEGPVRRRGGEGDLAALARRICVGIYLRRRGRSDDRRAPRLAARDRAWQRRNVSRLRRDCARAFHRHDQLSRRRRLGGDPSRRRADPRCGRRARQPRR